MQINKNVISCPEIHSKRQGDKTNNSGRCVRLCSRARSEDSFAEMRGRLCSRDAHLLFCLSVARWKAFLPNPLEERHIGEGLVLLLVGMAAESCLAALRQECSQKGICAPCLFVWKGDDSKKKTVFVLLICIGSAVDIVLINYVKGKEKGCMEKLCERWTLYIRFLHCSRRLYVQFGMYVIAFVNRRNRCSTWWFWTHGDV